MTISCRRSCLPSILYGHDTSTLHTDKQTDRRTDNLGSNTALWTTSRKKTTSCMS